VALTRNTYAAKIESVLGAANSTMTGLIRVIPYEMKQLSAKTIDLDSKLTEYSQVEEWLPKELESCNGAMEEIAYRQGKRYSKVIQKLPGGPRQEGIREGRISHDGVYVITGGLSGLGLVLAQHIVGKKPRGLVIVGRKQLPGDDGSGCAGCVGGADSAGSVGSTDNACSDSGYPAGEDAVVRAAYELKKLQAMGVPVIYRSADVRDREAMAGIIAEAKQNMGRIRGVIHCAGVIDHVSRTLRAKTPDSFKKVLYAKVHGAIILSEVTRNENLDFMFFCSSIASLRGNLGAALSDYAVANTFLDTYAYNLAGTGECQAVSVNWSLWEGIGYGARRAQGDLTFPLTAELGLNVFDHILEQNIRGNVTVMNVNAHNFSLDHLNKDFRKENFFKQDSVKQGSINSGNTRRELAAGQAEEMKVARRPEQGKSMVEDFIMGLLVRFLQLEKSEINKRRSFTEYGIDSVIVTDFVGAIEERYKIFTHPSIILEHPSVNSLAQYLIETFDAAKRETELSEEEAQSEIEAYQQEEVRIQAVNVQADRALDSAEEAAEPVIGGDNAERDLMEILEGLANSDLSVEQAIKRYGGSG
jgi:NAD(P)-dependent dehydrogenase (short-subunit alcohol dehydrogenase family)/acyl carrier protein